MSEQMLKAWDNKNKRWIDSFVVSETGKVIKTQWYDGELDYDYCIDATLCRSTGLRDSKRTKKFPDGEMIFENDIVKAIGFKPEFYLIEFIEGGFCLTNENINMIPIDINTLYPSIGCQIERVGNKFEHKNLLE